MRATVPLLLLAAACNTRSAAPAPGSSAARAAPIASVAAAARSAAAAPARPYGLHVPASWDHGSPLPVVLFFHGYGANGAAMVHALGLEAVSDAKGFALAFPDGTVDSRGKRFWNATDACCDFDHTGVDDVGYVRWLLDDLASKVPVDTRRVYVFGHSNGGFFANRLACDLAPRLAAAVSMSGAGWKDASRCAPGAPVSVLEISGDADDVIRAGGGRVFDLPLPAYPGVRATVASWAARDRCAGALAPVDPFAAAPLRGVRPTGTRLDFDAVVPGAETTTMEVGDCPAGVSVALWNVAGGSHYPSPSRAAIDAIWAWMAAHPRP